MKTNLFKMIANILIGKKIKIHIFTEETVTEITDVVLERTGDGYFVTVSCIDGKEFELWLDDEFEILNEE